MNEFVCRDVLDATTWPLYAKNQGELQRNETGQDFNATNDPPNITQKDAGRSRFDYIRRNCLMEVHEFFSEYGRSVHDYDLVVFGSGIWESVLPKNCTMNLTYFNKENNRAFTVGATLETKVDALLDILTATSSSKLQIVLRTPGFDYRNSNDTAILTIGEKMRNFVMNTNSSHPFSLSSHEIFQNDTTTANYSFRAVKTYSSYNQSSCRNFTKVTGANITVVDWQTVVAKRSFGEDRIKGDIEPHYGLEARHLFAQQLLHQLRRLELKRGDRKTHVKTMKKAFEKCKSTELKLKELQKLVQAKIEKKDISTYRQH